jgi:hypothetical protein
VCGPAVSERVSEDEVSDFGSDRPFEFGDISSALAALSSASGKLVFPAC